MFTLTKSLASPPLPHHLQHMPSLPLRTPPHDLCSLSSLCFLTLPYLFCSLPCLCSCTGLMFTNLPSLPSCNDWLLETRKFIFPIFHLSASTNIGFHSTTSESPLYTILLHLFPPYHDQALAFPSLALTLPSLRSHNNFLLH
ncbi:hypothetical protein O181_001892 [Austropuccinia psidii MF-1]|uniref:Uncharacterized protein n=1 Tax=Austropuccinia psidii MF-1 TaxID=1389203 RepID=A0A9Q3GDH8_9BASI|nr:hypothetical protein [Austropuccinia psidii MF-1]